ncbi:hypothetical protein [Butyrivibrio sp. AE2032]|uniref:hypothetical protein n=1 Tax=Butyrivibrio sp. AE2032 TaxID=1458463 RepID=UPI001639ACD7|nr:hypothetical protein [Butyrivibrio sp. AE2032]
MGVETQLIIVGEKLVIHMDGNRFNNILSGVSFSFRISLHDGRNGAKPKYGIAVKALSRAKGD